MTSDPIRLVQALVVAGSKEAVPKLHDAVPHGAVVTISRQYGTGGREVAHELAKALKVRCFDKEILDTIVEKAGVERYLMEQLDEHVSGNMSSWIYSLLTGKSVFPTDYRRHLFNVILAVSQKGGVIIGRGAHLILADKPEVLRLRIVCSLENRIERVMKRDGLAEEQALRKMREVDHDRDVFIRALFKVTGCEATDFDLAINTDRYSIDDAVQLTIDALKQRGAKVSDAP